ncbi:MAG TPA: hypothetical protein VK455_03625 [Thermoplasmata archaeon]|nr:hypothetical protein [Thermoplasmata archaeon]
MAPWIAVALIAFMLISELPVINQFDPHTPERAASPSLPAAATVPASTHTAPPRTVHPVSTASTNASLCLLGVEGACRAPSQIPVISLVPSVLPSAGDPSSWTNITPPVLNPTNNPSVRIQPAEAYDPALHATLLFGGEENALDYLADTWSYANNRWTELNSGASCTATTCPAPRLGAMLAYDPAAGGMVLFGGAFYLFLGVPIQVAYNDTWLFANDSWTNISSSVGNAPSPRFSGAMAYDPSDGYSLLFGGSTVYGNALGDTWKLAAGRWTNITSSEGGATGYESLQAPEPRAGAAISTSPSGYVMIFGGEDRQGGGATDIIQNWCNNGTYYDEGNSTIAWWFYQGKWTPMSNWGDTDTGPCTPIIKSPREPAVPTPAASAVVPNPPCGRVDAALGWSPKNGQFVLYGGYGSTAQSVNSVCSGGPGMLNDTWLYGNVSGGGYVWHNAGDSGDPLARAYMGYSSDFTSDYFEIFGGQVTSVDGPTVNQTWRFFEYVHAKLTGPDSYNTAPGIHLLSDLFTVLGYGGSGHLSYTLTQTELKTDNSLVSSCRQFNGAANTLPYNGTVTFHCAPSVGAYNVYRLTLTVTDINQTSDSATSIWIFYVLPPESMNIYSEYVSYFYQTVAVHNTFTIYAVVANLPATSIKASLGDRSITFAPSSNPKYWNATINMSGVAQGAILHAEANWGNWTQNATYKVTMIAFPGWLQDVIQTNGPNETFQSFGAGPFNKTYSVNDSYSWNIASGFSLPIELLGGDYNMIPSLGVNFTVTSMGYLSINGTLPLTSTSIDLGPASLSLSVGLSLLGTFDVVGDSIHWVKAVATISVSAGLSASIPIYGFDILGFTVGFVLDVTINVTAALSLVLAPTTDPSQDILPDVGIMIQNLLGSLTLAMSAAVDFGIGIASIGLGAGVSVALSFVTQPNFAISGGWVNGSIFVEASFLFWSDSWDIASGTIYSWDAPQPAPAYDNGTNTTWVLDNRYYNVTGFYDTNVWSPTLTSGPAVYDIYPSAEVTGAAGYNGAYLFYTNDNTSQPVQKGLEISGARLNTSSNGLTSIPSPKDPNFLIVDPQATTLPDGSLYVVWDALPVAEEGVTSPLDLTSLALQGASFYTTNQTWGPIHTYSAAGFAESYSVDATNTTGEVLELVSEQPLLNGSTPERLAEFDLATGALLHNVSATGISEIVSFRGGPGLAALETVGGNYTLVGLTTGSAVALSYTPPANYDLVSSRFVTDSESDLVLLYAGPDNTKLVLYNTSNGSTLGTLQVASNASDAEGIASGAAIYVFVRTADGLHGWTEKGGTFKDLAAFARPNVGSYGLVQAGGSIVLYALATNSTVTEPTVTLWLAEIGAALLPVPVPSSAREGGAATSTNTSTSYLVYLAIAAGLVAVILAAVAIRTRRRPPAAAPASWAPPAGAVGAEPAASPSPPPTQPPAG